MWFEEDDCRFQNWEWKSAEERVDACAERIFETECEKVPERKSLYFQLLKSLGEDAVKGNPLPDPDEAARVFDPIESFVRDTCWTVTDYDDEQQPNFWRHNRNLLNDARQGKRPPIRREDAEGIADAYLRLPYRSTVADRMVLDMLIAGELFAFAQEVFSQRKAQRFIGGGPTSFLFGRGCTLILVALLGGFAYLLNWLGVISHDVFIIVLLVLGGLAVLETVWAVLRFPFAWRAQSKHNTRTAQLVGDMNGVYCELNSSGPISARHIRERAQTVSGTGAVWPGPLFVILEESIQRGGRL